MKRLNDKEWLCDTVYPRGHGSPYIKVPAICSCFRRFILVFVPPGAVKPPGWPLFWIILWQGIIRGMGFLDKAEPTARAALGWFAAAASWL